MPAANHTIFMVSKRAFFFGALALFYPCVSHKIVVYSYYIRKGAPNQYYAGVDHRTGNIDLEQ